MGREDAEGGGVGVFPVSSPPGPLARPSLPMKGRESRPHVNIVSIQAGTRAGRRVTASISTHSLLV